MNKSAFWILTATLLMSLALQAQQGSVRPRYDLNGEWQAGFTVDRPQLQIEKVMIQQMADKIIATKITGDEFVPAGKTTVRGSYIENPFAAEQVCAGAGYKDPLWERITITIIDETHFKAEGGCSGNAVWERVGRPTLALDSSVLFDVDKFNLKPAAGATLQQLALFLRQNHPKSRLKIAGYTDDTGSDAHNLQLSKRRAQAVAVWLQTHGVDSSRLEVEGFGKANPRYPNTNSEARAHNRRVEIVVID